MVWPFSHSFVFLMWKEIVPFRGLPWRKKFLSAKHKPKYLSQLRLTYHEDEKK